MIFISLWDGLYLLAATICNPRKWALGGKSETEFLHLHMGCTDFNRPLHLRLGHYHPRGRAVSSIQFQVSIIEGLSLFQPVSLPLKYKTVQKFENKYSWISSL